jgi:hypothetical protein
VGARAADRAHVPYLRVADLAARLRQQRAGTRERLIVLQVGIARQRADRHLVAVLADVRQIRQAADVHQRRHVRQAQLQ